MPYNEWYSAKDERTCDFCLEMHGTVYGTNDTLFYEGQQLNVQVGDQMKTLQFGYEDVTCPPLHPNCRCTLLPRMDEGDRGLADLLTQQVAQALIVEAAEAL